MKPTSTLDRESAEVTITPLKRKLLPELIAVHLAAFDGYMNTRLGRGYVRAFLGWFEAEPDAIALAGILDGRPVGYVVGAPVGYQRRLNRDLAAVAGLAVALRPWLLGQADVRAALGARLAALIGRTRRGSVTVNGSQPPVPAMSLVGIGVAPSGRGAGVGGHLMSAFESEAVRRGARSLRLSVYRDNASACRLYERSGWRCFGSDGGRTVYYVKDLPSGEGPTR